MCTEVRMIILGCILTNVYEKKNDNETSIAYSETNSFGHTLAHLVRVAPRSAVNIRTGRCGKNIIGDHFIRLVPRT